MASGRMLNITVATDKRLNALSIEAHLLFLMTIPHLDRDGLIAGDAPLLAARVIPRRTELHPRIDALVAEWLAADLARIYETRDTAVIFFPGFVKNQKLQYDREAASQFPPPPGYIRTAAGLEPDDRSLDSGLTPELVQSDDGVSADQIPIKIKVKVKDEVKDEGEGEVPPLPAAPSSTAGRRAAATLTALNDQLAPALRRPLADALLSIMGKRALADAGGDVGDRLTQDAHAAAVTLYRMGLRTDADLLALEPTWAEDWRGRQGGTITQFLQFASEARAGKHKPGGNGNGHSGNGTAAKLGWSGRQKSAADVEWANAGGAGEHDTDQAF